MTGTYRPRPLDTSTVVLPTDLSALQEELATNAHAVWAAQRLQDGWRYGPTRDDEAREHPCLVPYEELPDSEKDYDRRLVGETLRAVLALGYTIHPPNT
ncbi:RyR domain-containing protein [Kribbella sancticallisti]|uniref:RyR domain-containing protein n=1 Tax=Kribbella sancticallisti TaxID=460087 RepID=A0ABP4PCF8_9ACTN